MTSSAWSYPPQQRQPFAPIRARIAVLVTHIYSVYLLKITLLLLSSLFIVCTRVEWYNPNSDGVLPLISYLTGPSHIIVPPIE